MTPQHGERTDRRSGTLLPRLVDELPYGKCELIGTPRQLSCALRARYHWDMHHEPPPLGGSSWAFSWDRSESGPAASTSSGHTRGYINHAGVNYVGDSTSPTSLKMTVVSSTSSRRRPVRFDRTKQGDGSWVMAQRGVHRDGSTAEFPVLQQSSTGHVRGRSTKFPEDQIVAFVEEGRLNGLSALTAQAMASEMYGCSLNTVRRYWDRRLRQR
jgi:hypothetical protein